jgi:branched-chain amino acid transport system ATP-binding protein
MSAGSQTADGTSGTPDSGTTLELRGVTGGYGRAVVLRDVNLTVGRGVIAALLGPNGAGKTTILRIAAGLMRPTAGSVLIAGVDATRNTAHDRARAGVCLVPEGRGVFPNLTVRENLRLQIPPRGRHDGLDRALDAFPVLRERLRQTAGTLSGGQQQMLATARCYLADPKVVLLDEVSMGLAPQIVDQIFESLQRLVAEGISILLVEQYVNRALEMASIVYLLNRGVISFAGRTADLDEDTVIRGYLGANVGGDALPSARRADVRHPARGESLHGGSGA